MPPSHSGCILGVNSLVGLLGLYRCASLALGVRAFISACLSSRVIRYPYRWVGVAGFVLDADCGRLDSAGAGLFIMRTGWVYAEIQPCDLLYFCQPLSCQRVCNLVVGFGTLTASCFSHVGSTLNDTLCESRYTPCNPVRYAVPSVNPFSAHVTRNRFVMRVGSELM